MLKRNLKTHLFRRGKPAISKIQATAKSRRKSPQVFQVPEAKSHKKSKSLFILFRANKKTEQMKQALS
jgi:hypothetical protein